MQTARSVVGILLAVAGLFCLPTLSGAEPVSLNTDQLDPPHHALLHTILQQLEPLITTRKADGTANLLTWDELYQPLDEPERAFLDAFRALKAETLGSTIPPPVGSPEANTPPGAGLTGGGTSRHSGEANAPDLVPVGTQETVNPVPRPDDRGLRRSPSGWSPLLPTLTGGASAWYGVKDGTRATLDPQFLPRPVLDAYRAMMDAMFKELGKRLLVESGYRAPAYQLHLFLFYLPKHGYSIRETNRFVALPGYSEHGNPNRQAIDFINEAGINGEDHPEEFEALPEYRWLTEHAREFGFFLSYPRDNPDHTSFEPWHWHFESGD